MSVIILCGWDLSTLGGYQPFLGGEFCLGGLVPPWVQAGVPKKGISPPIEGRSHTQKVVTDLKDDAQRLTRPLWENTFEGKLHQQSPSPISIGIGNGIGRLPS